MARIKGTAMLNVVKSLRALGKDRAMARVPEALHRFLQERILPSSWYAEEDHLVLMRVLGEMLKAAHPDLGEDVFVWMGRAGAQTDMATVYSSVMQGATPETALRRGATLWQSYHDTGSAQVKVLGPGKGRLELTGYALPSAELCRTLQGWLAGFLAAGGAADVRIAETACRTKGDPSCVWDVEWTESAG